MDQALQADLPLPRGGRLWVERTHACWTVDVDTAGTTGSASDLRRMINHAAAVETARQVRLRRAAGSVVVDFLRMERRDHAQEVIADLRAAFAEDHADLQFNDRLDRLGFYAFSRQRLGLELANRIADGGLRAAVLAGLRMLTRETLAQPGRPQALALSPQGAHLLTAMPVALAEASNMLGTPPVIQTDVSLAHAAFALRPIQ